MKKFSRREQRILKIMLLFVALGGVSKGYHHYKVTKQDLSGKIESTRASIADFKTQLEGEDPAKYLEFAVKIESGLNKARERVLELPEETDASLLIRQTLSEKSVSVGMNINSISNRKSKVLGEETGFRELRTYFGYDSSLESLLNFFDSFENQDYYLVIENLSVSARRKLKRSRNSKNKKRRVIKTREPLTGNAVIATIFKPNQDASLERYEKPTGEDAAAAASEVKADPASETASTNEVADVDPEEIGSSNSEDVLMRDFNAVLKRASTEGIPVDEELPPNSKTASSKFNTPIKSGLKPQPGPKKGGLERANPPEQPALEPKAAPLTGTAKPNKTGKGNHKF